MGESVGSTDTPLTRARVGVMWRGDWTAPEAPGRHADKLAPVMAALRAHGLTPEPIVYVEEREAALRHSLCALDGVLVWINPVEAGRTRAGADELLREVANAGVWVSAHPDTIAAMGAKDVLYRTRDLGWGSDTRRHDALPALLAALPSALANGPRVLKPLRGNDGRNVLKIALPDSSQRPACVTVQRAADDQVETIDIAALEPALAPLFDASSPVIDQEFHPVARGMVRCYMAFDRVVGFCEQSPRRAPSAGEPPAFGMQSSKTMHPANAALFGDLRRLMETEWTPGLVERCGLDPDTLPALWDADFLYRAAPYPAGRSRFALCEINASCVSPFPADAPAAIAEGVRRRLGLRESRVA